ncbi:MAG: cytochrome c3 family protein [Anaerosomatales bacterium]|nr:cytochrome c3 family protein [Anaerosomatales bacterium]
MPEREDGGVTVTQRCRRMAEVAVLVVLGACLVAVPGIAAAYNETTSTAPVTPDDLSTYPRHVAECAGCHGGLTFESCGDCHLGFPGDHGQGPHAGYLETSTKCSVCHTVHVSISSGPLLLPGPTVTATCQSCHDGTGGYGVYGAIWRRTNQLPGAEHGVETTSVVPGGDPNTGGSADFAFSGTSGTLSCSDCHAAHGGDQLVVAAFPGDRQRTAVDYNSRHVRESNKLLRRRPIGSDRTVVQYGSDWCLGCHQGRGVTTTVHNHPVDSLDSTNVATPFTYNNVAVLASDDPTSTTVLQALGGWNRNISETYAENRGYLIPWPRTAEQGAHYPICQQCHEDSRDVGTLLAPGNQGDAADFTLTAEDGRTATDNPRFQNFPHETLNESMLVEEEDDLCLNCHPSGQLP